MTFVHDRRSPSVEQVEDRREGGEAGGGGVIPFSASSRSMTASPSIESCRGEAGCAGSAEAPFVLGSSRVATWGSTLFTAAAAAFLAAIARVGHAFCRHLTAGGGHGTVQRLCRSCSGFIRTADQACSSEPSCSSCIEGTPGKTISRS